MKQLPLVEQLVRGKLFTCLILLFFSLPSHAQNTTSNLVVPVVFHIISQGVSPITDQQIIDAVADLNNAFAHSGPYASGAPGVNTGIRFCLAKTAPDGGNTTGITRTQSVLTDFDSDLETDRLTNLVSWNPREYCNIWVVTGMENEFLTRFSCGVWTRKHGIGSGTFDTTGNNRDGVITKDFGADLASLVGLWLGLKYTFVWGSCSNTNCDTDGDGICDTPPASAPASNCTAVQNSCTSDTLSGFAHDVPDLVSNFMSQSGSCASSFTAGQATKMRNNLIRARSTILAFNKCDPPCAENIVAGFTRDNWMPKTGDLVQFTSTSTGGTNYQWTVNGAAAGSNSPNFSMTYADTGTTIIGLKVYNANSACFASYTEKVLVNCGIMARFTPNVRQIASKQGIMLDSILFTNRSVNAASYEWWMTRDNGAPQMVSTSYDLNYFFKTPGAYVVWLVAINGSCHDTTEKFSFPVYDPTVEATIAFSDVQCYQQTKIKASFTVCNGGYAPMPAGTPVSFYDADPKSGSAHKLSPAFNLPAAVAGNCCSVYSVVLDVQRSGLNQLFAVVNDNGSSIPVKLPNTSLPEKDFNNNIGTESNFQFHVTAVPDSATLQPGDTLLISANAGPGTGASYIWSTAEDLSCTTCDSSLFIAQHKIYQATKMVVATSAYGCTDSAFTVLNVPASDDYRIHMDSLVCAGEDSMHVSFTLCNLFKRGNIPKGLRVSFYDADPVEAGAHLLGPVFSTSEANPATCASYESFLRRTTTGQVFAFVNPNEQDTTGFPGNYYDEVSFANNKDTMASTPFLVSISPGDTSISKLTSIQFNPQISGGQATQYKWEPAQFLSCADCPSPVARPEQTITYQLTVENAYACTAEASTSVKVFSGGLVNIPNGFSPNGDGHNDVFYILGGPEVKMMKDFSIFNRWGQKIFQVTNAEANDPGFGWNGTMNGKPAEPDTYVYFVTIVFTDGTTHLYKGTVTLLR